MKFSKCATTRKEDFDPTNSKPPWVAMPSSSASKSDTDRRGPAGMTPPGHPILPARITDDRLETENVQGGLYAARIAGRYRHCERVDRHLVTGRPESA